VIVVREYLDATGRSPIARWFDDLDAVAAAKVTTALARLAGGNVSNTKSLGGGIHEIKIDFGPGYRVYFGYDGPTLVLLLAGGTKKRQSKDIETAAARWRDYRLRRTKG